MRLLFMIAMMMFLPMAVLAPTFVMADEPMALPTDRGPAVGQMTPSNLAVINQDGEPTNFAALTGDKGLVLVFVRSLKWCPFCKKQVQELAPAVADIEARGYNLVALSYDSLKDIQRFVEDNEISFSVLSDRKSAVIDAFDIRNEQFGKAHFANGVPHPMIFVIGKDKIIQAKLAEEGYKARPPITVILETLDGLEMTAAE